MNIYHYNQEERWENFLEVMMCLLTLHATLNGTVISSDSELVQSVDLDSLPSTEEYEQMLTDFASFNTNDPSDKYDITS